MQSAAFQSDQNITLREVLSNYEPFGIYNADRGPHDIESDAPFFFCKQFRNLGKFASGKINGRKLATAT